MTTNMTRTWSFLTAPSSMVEPLPFTLISARKRHTPLYFLSAVACFYEEKEP